ncbi:MAG: hypothetical protein VX475_04805, partial [Myxococcota bacterium]|nr:hypothetical protein [Myxococcota bacterium]
ILWAEIIAVSREVFTMTARFLPHFISSLVLLVCVGGIPSLATTASAKENDKSTPEPIVVVPLDNNSATMPLVHKAIDVLRANNYKTLNDKQVQLMLDRTKVALDRVDASRLNAVVPIIGPGTNNYFLQPPSATINSFAGPIRDGRSNLSALAARKAEAQTLYGGNVILARAYFDDGQLDKARAEVADLVRLFPTMQPNAGNNPPELIQMFADARAELDKKKTSLTFLPFTSSSASDCKLFVNGFEARGNGPFAVDPSQEYILQMDCFRGSAPLGWRYTPTAGENNEVPIIDVEPLKMTMRDGSFDDRTEIEQRILFLFFWTEIETFVGISKNGASGTSDAMLLARASRADGQVRWSDQNSAPYCDALKGFFPNLEFPDGACDVPGQAKARSRLPGVLTTVVGLAGVGVGSFFWVSYERRVDKLRCSDSYGSADSDSCSGIDPYTAEEIDALAPTENDKNELPGLYTRNRNIGIGITAAGSALVIGGLVWTLASPGKNSDRRAKFGLVPNREGGMVTIHADF